MKWKLFYQITVSSRTPDQGATAPRSPFSLSSTEFVEPPSPEQNSWVRHCSQVFLIYSPSIQVSAPQKAVLQMQHLTSFCLKLNSNLLLKRVLFLLNAAFAIAVMDVTSCVYFTSFIMLQIPHGLDCDSICSLSLTVQGTSSASDQVRSGLYRTCRHNNLILRITASLQQQARN